MCGKGALGDLAVVDVDMVNFFGSVEWQPMLETYADIFPEGLQWEAYRTTQSCVATMRGRAEG